MCCQKHGHIYEVLVREPTTCKSQQEDKVIRVGLSPSQSTVESGESRGLPMLGTRWSPGRKWIWCIIYVHKDYIYRYRNPIIPKTSSASSSSQTSVFHSEYIFAEFQTNGALSLSLKVGGGVFPRKILTPPPRTCCLTDWDFEQNDAIIMTSLCWYDCSSLWYDTGLYSLAQRQLLSHSLRHKGRNPHKRTSWK